jgi:glycosyltransferase involved in cell wall biosynthesis
MSVPLRVLIVTDSFPPNCGGSGWSTYELTRGLRARGHHVEVVRVRTGARSGVSDEIYEGIPVTTFRKHAPTTPVIRNIVKNERLWNELADYLRGRLDETPVDIVHAQHVMTTVPAIRAGRAAGIPVVATVRDYWPVCYWSDLIYDPAAADLCPRCTPGMMTRCVRPRSGRAWPAALAIIPYMRANLRAKRHALARADAVIAVSSAIARDLRTRAPELATTQMYTVPNPVEMTGLIDVCDHVAPPMDGPYVLYAGKLAMNKGTQFLLPAIERAGITWPLVIVGDGPERRALEADARTRGLDARFLGWLPRQDALAWMRHATMLAFPSYGPESLSRVLIEASALGVPIAAMDTGGTRDIVTADVTGLVAADPAGFAADLARLANDEVLRATLGRAALADARTRFDAGAICARVELIYRALLLPRAA